MRRLIRAVLCASTFVCAAPCISAELSISEGVVVKFGADAGLVVRDRVTIDGPVIFTSINDPTAGGTTAGALASPQAGDWRGIAIQPGALVADVQLDDADIRYAGASGGAGLSFSRLPFEISALTVTHSIVGVRAGPGGSAVMTGLSLRDNQIGLRVEGASTPRITGSELAGNALFGVQNQTPSSIVNATANWWGHPSGPHDALANPTGQGDSVSAGVDYGQYLTDLPLAGCRLSVADGNYRVVIRALTLRLRCRNAVEYRLSESTDFSGAAFLPIAATAAYQLSAPAGTKLVYAQYRGQGGQTTTAVLPEPVIYTPSLPTVIFLEPAENALITTNTSLRISAADPTGIASVSAEANGQAIGTDTNTPYEIEWDISGIADGAYTLAAIATNSEGRSTQVSRRVRVERMSPEPDTYSFAEGEVLFVDTPGLLANDHVVSTAGLNVDLVQAPAWGTVALDNDGSFGFRPDTPDRNGTATFKYRLRSNGLTSPPVLVTINVTPVNDPPNVTADSYLGDENVQIDVAAPGVLANDRDVDSSVLRAELSANADHGVVSLTETGGFSYVPEVNFRGTDSFQYAALDETGGSSIGTVTLMVTQPPTATNDVYLVDINTPLEVTDPELGLLVNDHDAPERDPLAATLAGEPNHGNLVLQANGTFNYTPDANFVGIDTFSYQVTDTRSVSNIANVTLAVGITSLPRAVPDSYTAAEDQELVVDAEHGMLANDTDADTPRSELRPTVVSIAEGDFVPGSLVVNADGSFRLTPRQNFSGETFFVYQVYDGASVSNAAVVTIDVMQVNDGVQAEDDRFGVLRNTVLVANGCVGNGAIFCNDRYDDDFDVNFEVTTQPAHGQVEINPVSGVMRYTPNRDFFGLDVFEYRIYQPSTGIGDTAQVTLRTNGPPTPAPDYYTIDEDSIGLVSPSVLANDTDPDGDTLHLSGTYFQHYSGFASMRVNSPDNPTASTASATRNYYGTIVFSYGVSDGTSNALGAITYNVRPVPDAPIAANDTYLVQRNAALIADEESEGVLRNDYDPDARFSAGAAPWPSATGVDLAPLQVELVATPAHGILVLDAAGTFVYTPAVDYSGVDAFRYRLTDATARSSDVATVSVRVNSPAQAVDDAYVVNEDTVLLPSPAQGLLANDIDADGDALNASPSFHPCSPCHGTVQIRPDGSFRYVPEENYAGSDEFYYRVGDRVSGLDEGRVQITILPVNDAPITDSDTYRTPEDVVLIAPEAQGLLRNDREVDGEQLTNASVLALPSHGALTIAATGDFSYTPQPNFNGRDTFRYRVFDESNLYSDEDVEVLVTAVNDAPDAVNDSYEIDQDQVLMRGDATGLLANDADVDSTALTATVISGPLHGQLQLATNGSFSYRPDGASVGIDQFQYQLSDDLGAVDSAAVTINVRPVGTPVQINVVDDFYRFVGPQFLASAPGLLGNDSVVGATGLTAALVVAPQVGSVSVNPNGGFSYVAPPDFTGAVTFTYSASASGSSELGLVTLDVQAAENVPPVAVGEQFGVLEDGFLDSRSAGGLLVNDSDHEGAALSLIMVEQPGHGALVTHPEGDFTYRPDANFNGSDRFTYRVSDGAVSSNLATAEIGVFAQNDAPDAAADTYQVLRGQSLTVAAAQGLLANDSDPDGDSITVELVDAPAQGQVQVSATGAFVYQPQPGYTGVDRFRYAASDGVARSVAVATINVVLPGNGAPVAQGENLKTDEDTILSSDAVGLLTANDSDPDGDALAVLLTEGPAHGQLMINGGAFSYTPDADFAGSDQFHYRVSDGALSSAPVTAIIAVRAVNDAPRPQADLYAVMQGSVLAVTASQGVLANDADVEGQPLRADPGGTTAHGPLVLAADGSFSYQPNANFHGRDEFSYWANDGVAAAEARVAIDVTTGANQRPIAIGETFAIPEDTVLDTTTLGSLLANDVDPDGQPLTLVIVAPPTRGSLEVLPGGHIRYTPARDDTGSVHVGYTVSDGVLTAVPVEVEIVLLARNDQPQAGPDLYSLPTGQTGLTVSAEFGVLANDRDPDGDTLVTSVVTPPGSGSLNLGLDGSFIYVPGSPRPATDQFSYRVSDPAALNAVGSVRIVLDQQVPGDNLFYAGFEGLQ